MIHFRLWEQVLFLVLAIASVTLFGMRFRKIWRSIQASKDDPEFGIHPIGRRVRDFVWEVLLQGKVIRQRPLPGIATSSPLVFYGLRDESLRPNHAENSASGQPPPWLDDRRVCAVLAAPSLARYTRRDLPRPRVPPLPSVPR